MKSRTMKRTIAHLFVALVLAGFVRADQTTQSVQQTTQSVQQALKNQGVYYGNVGPGSQVSYDLLIRYFTLRVGG